MSFGITPQFTYNSGAGNVSFTPTYPPVNKPLANEIEVTANVSISSAGVKQTVVDRTDNFITLQFDYVPAADIAAWTLFMAWACQGGVFTYAPDVTAPGTNQQYTLEDTNWTPTRAIIGHAKFKFRMRQYVP